MLFADHSGRQYIFRRITRENKVLSYNFICIYNVLRKLFSNLVHCFTSATEYSCDDTGILAQDIKNLYGNTLGFYLL